MKRIIYLPLISFYFSLAFANNQIDNFYIFEKGNTLYANINSQIELNQTIKDSVQQGLNLTFSYTFLFKAKSWWGHKDIAEIKKNYQVNYNQTIQKYIVYNPVTFEKFYFKYLENVVGFMQNLGSFPLVDKRQLTEKIDFVQVRFKLDKDKLPILIRLESLINEQWDIKSNWLIWKFL